MSGRMVSADASPALPWRTGEPTLQASWFDEAWEASLSFIKGECNGPAAILLDVALGMVPVVGQIIDARDIILGLIDVSEQPEDADAWFNLITALIGLVPGGGDALKRALRAIHRLQAPADTLLAMLRGFGRGNVEKLVLDMLDVSRIKGSMQTLQATLRSNGFLQTLSAGTRQRILHTASRLQVGLERQFVQFEKQVRGWLKRQPNTSVEPEYVSKTVAKKADKTNAKPGVAIESKEHSNVAHAGRHNVYTQAVAELKQQQIYFMGVLGEHMADYWVIEKGWATGWHAHDDGMDGKWSAPAADHSAPRKLNDGGSMTPLWPLVPRGRGLDAVWRTNGANGKPYAIIEAKAYTNPGIALKTMLADTLDKREYSRYREKLRNFKKSATATKRAKRKLPRSDGHSGDPGGKPVNKPAKPAKEVMQMSHKWIRQRLDGTLIGSQADFAALRRTRRGERSYSRHVLLFSVPEVFDHTMAIYKWLRHELGKGAQPNDHDHASHPVTKTFGDNELDAEEVRRKMERSVIKKEAA